MKKLLFIFVLFLAGFTANAQSASKLEGNGKIISQTRNTSDYDAIKISGSFDVDLVTGKEGKIALKGEENLLASVKVEVEGNTLNIYMQKNTSIRTSNGQKIEVTIPIEKITDLNLSGSGNIRSKDAIKNESFSAKLSGSGNFNLNLDTNSFQLNVSGSGNANVKGKADNFTTKLSGSGDIDAVNLNAKKVEATVSGSGNSRVTSTESITARVSGSGKIKYAGNPEKRDVKVSGSGNISKA